MKQKLILAALLAVSLAACTNDNDPTVPGDGEVAARIVADIDNVATRASGTAWTTNDRIGISTVPGTKTQYNNIPYIWDEGNFKADDGGTIYFQSPETVTFYAYYPYNENGGTVEATTDAEAQKNLPAIDFLYASGATADKTDPTVRFTGEASFRHCMSQITISLKEGDNMNFSNGKLESYTLNGLVLKGSFDSETGIAETTAEEQASALTMKIEGDYSPAPVILFPQETGGTIGLEVSVEGETYNATLRIPEGKDGLQAGRHYIFPVTVKKTGLTVGTAEIKDWNTVTGSDDTVAVM